MKLIGAFPFFILSLCINYVHSQIGAGTVSNAVCNSYICSSTYKSCFYKSGTNVFINSNAC